MMFLELPNVHIKNRGQNKSNLIKNGVLGVPGGLLSYAYTDAHCLHVWIRVSNQWILARKITSWYLMINTAIAYRSLECFRVHIGPNEHSLLFKPAGFDKFDPRLVFFKLPGCIISYNFQDGKIETLQYHSPEQKAEAVLPCVLPQLPFTVWSFRA
ncbi:unnamed protein product [Ilex paraguariensis]|uniref:F-box protein n=1 Tax=Ilex paraguariensis TaxID=185542 RepID=A0ABC8UKE3_9AQUA